MSVSDPENATFITVSPQLALWLLYLKNKKIADTNKSAWETPNIVTLESWLKDLWNSSWPSSYIISKTQSLKLWETIIEDDLKLEDNYSLKLEGLAQSAYKAYESIELYFIPNGLDFIADSLESETFLKWSKKYEKKLKDLEAMDPSELTNRVCDGINSGQIPLPYQPLIFSGFFEFNPALEKLIKLLSDKGVSISKNEFAEEKVKSSPIQIFESKTIREESQLCTKFIKKNYKPGATFGIILCDYSKYSGVLTKELISELSPRYMFPWLKEDVPFNLESNTPLIKEPIIQQALSILSSNQNISLETFTDFLHSPFYKGFYEEQEIRRKIDQDFHKEKRLRIDLGKSDAFPSALPILKKNLKTWFLFVKDSQARTPSVWTRIFSQTLRQLGWPNGDRETNLRTNLVYEAWIKCLDSLASLDHVLGLQTKQKAWTTLKRFAEGKSFNAQTKNKPIQILGFPNATGMQFDYIWILGANADSLPLTSSPNPFIPIKVQKKLKIPHSSPEWELDFTKNLLFQLRSKSKNIAFSYSLWDKDIKLRISPLLSQFSDNACNISYLKTANLETQNKAETFLESFEEDVEIPVLEKEISIKKKDWSRSGYRLIKNQSSCPFKAFATHRLFLNAVYIPESDFEKPERGILIHSSLERIWNYLKDSSNLRNLLENDQLLDLIKNKIDEVFEKTSEHLKKQIYFFDLEKKRVALLIEKWLKNEDLRQSFAIFCIESAQTINLAGLDLNVRIDRIDTLSDGSHFIIDYKTGMINTADWFQERIQEPQLPLYAIKLKPAGIAYAKIFKGNQASSFSYLSKDYSKLQFPNVPTSFEKKTGISEWEQLLEYWEICLSNLAKNFLKGRTEIDPFRPGITCKSCGYKSLCRIAETNLEAFLQGDEEAE